LISKNKIKFINSLKEKKYRQLHSLFVVEGDKIVSEIIHQEPARIEQLFLTANWIKRSGLSSGQKSALPVIILKPGEMERISSLKSPPGAIALMQIPRYQLEVDEIAGKLSLVLDKIRDPGNLGNIIRIADWFGIDNIICSADCADCFNPKVLQSSMGSIMRVRIHYTGLEILLQKLTQLPEFGVYGTFPQAPDIYTADLLPRGIIIMGNESKGITGELLPFIRERISIPAFRHRSGKMDSLNVAAATAIICSEFRRRLR
jgi:TrmH family RNA methyltransferase